MNKFLFFFKRPTVIVVAGNGRNVAKEAIFQVLNRYFNVGKEVLLLDADKSSGFFLKKSKFPILLVTHFGEYHPDKEFFVGEIEKVKEADKLAEILPACGYLLLNFDDETVRNIKRKNRARSLTFGFGARANLCATDVILTQSPNAGTNFKINYQGNTVPVWLEKLFGKEQIYAALASAAVGEALDLNLVEISSALKFYQYPVGKMRLLKGIKNSQILDDSEGASALSMAEALEIFGKIMAPRKIAVLGDILEVGKHAIAVHEAIGEKTVKTADLLFTIGSRAGFFAEGAAKKGMAKDRIFKFNNPKEAGLALQKEIKPGDLILVDGCKEMNMREIIEEIRAF